MITQPLDIAPQPPEKAISYLQNKGYKLSWDWHDMWQSEHASAFSVAKITKVDILQDIHAALIKAQTDGTTFEQFKKDLIPTLQRKGWWGRQDAANVVTGEVRESVQLGSPRRLQTIFNVNVQTSLQVGHYKAMTDPDVLKARPFWRYSAVMDGRTRPMHRQWHNMVLPAGADWWDTHFPPNGWNCRCTVVSMSMREIVRDGLKVSEEPPQKHVDWKNPTTGKVEQIPEGIDAGWAYNPGKAAAVQVQAIAGEKVITAPEPLRWKLLNDLRAEDISKEFNAWTSRLIDPANRLPENRWKVPGVPSYGTTGVVTTLDHLSQNLVEQLTELGYPPETTAITISDSEWFHLQHAEQTAFKAKRNPENLLTREQALRLPQLVRGAKAAVWDETEKRMLYVFDIEMKQEKVAVAINARVNGEIGNPVKTARIIGPNDVRPGKRYSVLEGSLE